MRHYSEKEIEELFEWLDDLTLGDLDLLRAYWLGLKGVSVQ